MSGSATVLAQAIGSTTEALRAACVDPSDAVRLLITLAQYSDDVPDSPAQEAAASMCRRSALTSLALAIAQYTPPSADAATQLLGQAAALYDAEAQIAADSFDSDAYDYIKALKTSVVTYLNNLTQSLAYLRAVNTTFAQPSLALAYALYGDSTRADEIAALTDAPHPGILPLSMSLLAF